MEAIKTILDIQASQLTLVSPSRGWVGRGVWGGPSICVTMANRAHTPPSHCKLQKGTRVGLLLAVEK